MITEKVMENIMLAVEIRECIFVLIKTERKKCEKNLWQENRVIQKTNKKTIVKCTIKRKSISQETRFFFRKYLRNDTKSRKTTKE